MLLFSCLLLFVVRHLSDHRQMHCVYYLDAPIKNPPSLPIPGSEEESEEGADLHECTLPMYMGRTYPVTCKFWCIVQEVTAMYHEAAGGDLVDHVPLSFVEAAYRKLLYWADTLNTAMAREEDSSEHVLLFQ